MVNTSEVVDERLIQALSNRDFAGAGLDVFEHGPQIDPKLLKLSNVVLLPHMGSATIEGRIDMGEKVVVNVKTFVDGHRRRTGYWNLVLNVRLAGINGLKSCGLCQILPSRRISSVFPLHDRPSCWHRAYIVHMTMRKTCSRYQTISRIVGCAAEYAIGSRATCEGSSRRVINQQMTGQAGAETEQFFDHFSGRSVPITATTAPNAGLLTARDHARRRFSWE